MEARNYQDRRHSYGDKVMRFPDPPKEYDPEYMARLVQNLSAINQEIRRKDVTFSMVNITDLPTSATGLSPGQLWNDAGTVKVA